MIVLDADSVISGNCLTTLVRLMQANPTAGIIQTAPRAAGRDTLYGASYPTVFDARLRSVVYRRSTLRQLGESPYWGDNAIICLQPFMKHCALAPLPGEGALAREILSHDFVEAALMRRPGWGGWIAYDLAGSYEEIPPQPVGRAKARSPLVSGQPDEFTAVPGAWHAVHRAVFVTGVMDLPVGATVVFVPAVVDGFAGSAHTLVAPEYFSAPGQRFPLWPEWHPEGALALFTATATLLFLPKVLSVFLIWVKGACEFGGASRLADSIVMLLLFSGMLAPVRMLFHMRFVIGAFLGWMDHQLEIAAARGCRNQLGRSLPAVMEATPCWDWSGTAQYIGWRQDSCGGCCRLSVPLSVFSSRVTLGRSFRRARLFVISEEVDLPSELAATILYNDNGKVLSNFDDAVVDPLCNALLCAALTARPGSTGCDLVHPSNIGSECI